MITMKPKHTRKIALLTEYCGTNYAGWQRQDNAYTVQAAIEDALLDLLGQEVRLTASSRTDAGVHALGHVSHFTLKEHTIPTDAIPRALISKLPPDISVLQAVEVPETFHARFHPVAKTYQYHILNRTIPSALEHDRVAHVPGRLDVAKMQEGCRAFVGKHDFLALQASGATTKTSVRTIYRLALKQVSQERLVIEVEGDGFLYNMVRILAGTLLYVGQGKIEVESLPERIVSLDRRQMGKTMPPHGLYLAQVSYNPSPFSVSHK